MCAAFALGKKILEVNESCFRARGKMGVTFLETLLDQTFVLVIFFILNALKLLFFSASFPEGQICNLHRSVPRPFISAVITFSFLPSLVKFGHIQLSVSPEYFNRCEARDLVQGTVQRQDCVIAAFAVLCTSTIWRLLHVFFLFSERFHMFREQHLCTENSEGKRGNFNLFA